MLMKKFFAGLLASIMLMSVLFVPALLQESLLPAVLLL